MARSTGEIPNFSETERPGYRLQYTLHGHQSAISSVKFSVNGEWLASCSYDKLIKLWNVADGTLQRNIIGHKRGISDIDWSKDSRFLVSASDDKKLKIWDVLNGKCLKTLRGHTDIVFCTKYNQKKNLILSGSDDLTVKMWDASTGKYIKDLVQHAKRVTAVDFDYNHDLMLTASNDGSCYIYDRKTEAPVQTIRYDDNEAILFAKFSPNGKYVITATLDTLKLWNVYKGKCVRVYQGHRNGQFSVFANFSIPEGKWIISGSQDRLIYIWHINSQHVVEKLAGHTDMVLCTDYHPTQNLIASGALEDDCTVKIWRRR